MATVVRCPEWTGFNFEGIEALFPQLNCDLKRFTQLTTHKICQIKNPYFGVIANGGLSQYDGIVGEVGIDDISYVLTKACKHKVGEFPVIVGTNGSCSVNIYIINSEFVYANLESFKAFVSNVLGCSEVAAVELGVDCREKVRIFNLVTHVLPNTLYIPTHNEVPILWVCDGIRSVEAVFNNGSKFSTDEIIDWFHKYVKPVKERLSYSSVLYDGRECCLFMFNTHYMRYNGSAPYYEILYPVLETIFYNIALNSTQKDVVRVCSAQEGVERVCSQWSNLDLWVKFEGQLSASFDFTNTRDGSDVSVEPATIDDSLGKWEKAKDYQTDGTLGATVGKLKADDIAARLVLQAVRNETATIRIYNVKSTDVIEWQFTPADDVKVLGNTTTIAEELMRVIELSGEYDLDNDFIVP